MDAFAVVAMASWVIAELVRVFHNLDVGEAQKAVDTLVERRLPTVWTDGNIRRVLRPDLHLKEQIMLLIVSCPDSVSVDDLFKWTDYKNRSHFNRVLRSLHESRLVELDQTVGKVTLLPPGADHVTDLIQKLA
jgi:hypothetical protein